VQQAFLTQSLEQRKLMLANMREGSRDAQRGMQANIMDVNPQAIDQLFVEHHVNMMIHGHTHRPATHVTLTGVRHVLPDWDCDGTTIRGGWLALDTAGNFKPIKLSER
jgi:UDP-2,3-diacylglucosamine hydrolase